MGCVADKPTNVPHEPPSSKTVNIPSLPYLEKDPIAKSEFFEAIKKKDIILFKKTLSNYNVRPTDIVGPLEQKKTVLHKLAEYNFSEAMELVLSIISNQKPPVIQKILNVKDSDGNTPALLCCLANSVETLEVLTKSDCVDLEAKNAAKKTALEIAMEMESPCINVLTNTHSGSAVTTKATLKSITGDSSQHLEEGSKGQYSDRDLDSVSGGHGSRGSLNGGTSSLARDSKKLKGLRDPLKPNLTLRLPQMLIDLEVQNTNFIDNEFPHETCYLDGEETEEEFVKKHPGLAWKRPSEITGIASKITQLYETFVLADVEKSPLIGSEVYSALAVMAEFPQRLSRVLNTKQLSKHGIYSVNFNVAGIPIEILLDDYIPCVDHSKPLFARPAGSELWFLLFEKAFAKLYGGYKQLEDVDISEALEVLTGMPVAKGLLKDAAEDKLWRKLIDYDKKNYIMCAGQVEDSSNRHKNRVYNIVNLFEVNGNRLLKIRNHFGHYDWKGDFSATSSNWTKEIIDKVGYSQSDKSCFFMELSDFTKKFGTLTICHYHDSWIRTQLSISSKPKTYEFFKLTVPRDTEAYISVHQKHPQFVDEGLEYNISPVEIIMAKDIDAINVEEITFGERNAFLGKPTVYVQDGLESKLTAGQYTICANIKWVDNEEHEFCLNVLSSNNLELSRAEGYGYQGFHERVYLSAGVASKDKFDMTNNCEFVSGWAGSHLWVCAFNRGNKKWDLEIVFDKMQNVKIVKKFRAKPNSIKMVLQPNQKAVAFAKRTNADTVGVAWHFNQHWE